MSSIFKSKSQKFWDWFMRNTDEIFKIETAREPVADKLFHELRKVDSDLTFALGATINGKREFVISADGFKRAIPVVENIIKDAPVLDNWTFIAFRPPLKTMNTINFNGLIVDPKNVYFEFVGKENGLTHIKIYIPGYKEEDKRFLGASFVLLDNAVGEKRVMSEIGAVEIDELENKKNLYLLKELKKLL